MKPGETMSKIGCNVHKFHSRDDLDTTSSIDSSPSAQSLLRLHALFASDSTHFPQAVTIYRRNLWTPDLYIFQTTSMEEIVISIYPRLPRDRLTIRRSRYSFKNSCYIYTYNYDHFLSHNARHVQFVYTSGFRST